MNAAKLSDALSAALKRNRETFNLKFAAARRAGANIDPNDFLDFISAVLDPVIAGIAVEFSEKAEQAAVALYELSLELFAQGLLGRQARSRDVTDVWRVLLPAASRQLARNPRLVAASASNAVYQIGKTAGARPRDWISAMTAVAAHCQAPQEFLDAGKVAAWMAGCPQYRAGAMTIAPSLPDAVLASLFRPELESSSGLARKALESLPSNPWLTVAEAAAGADLSRIRLVRRAGSFSGFGGAFLRPPVVAATDNRILAGDGQSVCAVIADAYGCLLPRINAPMPAPGRLAAPLELSACGEVKWNGAGAKFGELAGWSSAAFDGRTLAVTLPTSHHVFLIARG